MHLDHLLVHTEAKLPLRLRGYDLHQQYHGCNEKHTVCKWRRLIEVHLMEQVLRSHCLVCLVNVRPSITEQLLIVHHPETVEH